MPRAVLAFLACAALLGQGAPSDDDMVLLQPFLESTPLGEGIEAYSVQGCVLVPLGELCRLLGFGITVDPGRTSASGFFIKPGRKFSLDLAKGTVEVMGRPAPLGRTARMPRDLYVDARSLGVWFPLKIETSLKSSTLVITPTERLPIQDAWLREQQLSGNPAGAPGDPAGAKAPVRAIPYSFMSLPMIDLNLGGAQTVNPASGSANGSAVVGGDLLWMSADLNPVRDSTGGWSTSRYTLFREDPDAGILGPLKARSLDLGDLPNTPATDLVGSLPQGRGTNLDNYPVTYNTRFAARTFEGPLAQGWSVELYQNDSLAGFQKSTENGLYQFKDVPLRFGVNQFRLVFHGPLGETTEKQYRLDIAQSQPPPGALYYGVSGVRPTSQQLAAFLQDQNLGTTSTTGTAGSTTPGVSPPIPAPRAAFLARADYGLNATFSAQGSVTGLQLQDGYHTYPSLGLKGVWSYLAMQGTVAEDHGPNPSAGRAVEGILSTGTGYSTLTLRRDQFSGGFEQSSQTGGDLASQGQVLQSDTSASLNWAPKLYGRSWSLTGSLEQVDYVGGGAGTRKEFDLSTQVGRVNLTNNLLRIALPGQAATTQGTLTGTNFADNWGWNGSLNYSGSVLNGWSLQGQYTPVGKWQYQLGVVGPLGPAGAPGHQNGYQFSGGVAKSSGRYGLGWNILVSGRTFSSSLTLQISLGREPRTRTWTSDAQSMATTGSVSAIAFLDNHGTGVRTPDDPVLEGARFKVAGSQTPSAIDSKDTAFITRLARSQPVEIGLDENSLDDSSLKSQQKAQTVVPRPGRTFQLEFPVAPFGEVNGTTRILRDGKKTELPGLEVELVDAQGKRIKALRSAYDGFYEFTNVPVGQYTLRVTPEEAARVKLKPAERPVRVEPGHTYWDGMDLVVEPLNNP